MVLPVADADLPDQARPAETIRVFVVEDDELLLSTLGESLSCELGLEIAGSAASVREAIERVDASMHVALVDLGLGTESGVELIASLHQRFPELDLMAHTVFDDRDVVFQALRAGATGYVLKGGTGADVAAAIRELRAGGSPMSPRIARMVIRQMQEGSASDLLSPRARQVLRCIDEGLTYKEVAQKLAISVHTVHSHIKTIYERLQVASKREALASARAKGLL